MSEILFLAHRIPFPPNRGDKIRSFHILKHLSGLARVHLACFADDEADAAHLAGLREALGGRLGEAHVEVRRTSKAAAAARALLENKPVSLTLFDSPRLRAFAHSVLARPEVSTAFAFSGQMAQFVPAGTRLIMDFVEMDSAKFEAYAAEGGPLAPVHRREAKKLFAFERATAARAEASLFVSDAEARMFLARLGRGFEGVGSVHNGVDLVYYSPSATFPAAPKGEGPLLVFTGQMDYAPNVDAVSWFAGEVLPHVPRARFAIVGRSPTETVKRLASERVIVTGAVPDTRSWLASADVVVAPLRIARGIQNKVLEAMAMAKAVVASPCAFEGIEAMPGRDLLVADAARDQANAINTLLSDPARAAAIGAAARRRVEEAYRWDVRLAPLTGLLNLPTRQAAA